MAEPTCPKCGVAGVEHIQSKESVERSRTKQPWYLVVYCDACGHVYNVLAKHVFSQPVTPKLKLPGL
ncbi:MAG: transcriptional regulator [Pseudomonadales bacterium]